MFIGVEQVIQKKWRIKSLQAQKQPVQTSWMRLWEKRCDDAGMLFACDYVICNEAPDDEAKEACAKLGAALV